jgi:glucosamine--fructose-6-phosphate aminotransferase (isomerizing)
VSLNTDYVSHEKSAILARMREEISAICTEAPQVWQRCLTQAGGISTLPGTTVITGCGDSNYAGLAVRQALEGMLGRPVIAWPAMDAASYPSRVLGEALLIAVSVSGKVGRTIDAVTAHNRRGGTTVAVTAYDDSDLAQAAGDVIATGVRGTPGPVPGTANYVASILGLLAFGAVRSGRDAIAADIVSVLAELPGLLQRTTEFFRETVREVQEPVFMVGSGPDWGTANYATAKLLEAAGAVSVPQDLEEWAHEQYFATGEGRTVLAFGHDDAAQTGARQVAEMAAAVGGRTIGIGRNLGPAVERALRLPETPPGLSPLLTWLPAALFALEFAEYHQRSPFGLDQIGRMQTVDQNIFVASPSRA